MAVMAHPINKLATELLGEILQSLYDPHRPGDFVPYLQCCRRWHDLGLRILYRHTVLTNSTLHRINESVRHSALGHVRSLTVRFTPEYPTEGHPFYRLKTDTELFRSLMNLATTLRQMVNLNTFSFTITPDFTFKGIFCIDQRMVNALLEALPMACVNLELDTLGLDFVYVEHTQHHSCEHIAKILPRLQHLWLRIQHICPEAFVQADHIGGMGITHHPLAPKLQSLYVNLLSYKGPASPSSRSHAFVCNTREQDVGTVRRARDPIVQVLRRLYEKQNFPSIRKALVLDHWKELDLDAKPELHNEPDDEDTLGKSRIYKGDILNNKAAILPYQWATHSPRSPRPLHLNDFEAIRDEYGDLLFGSVDEYVRSIDGHSWVQTTDGPRFPRMHLTDGRRKGNIVEKTAMMNWEQAKKACVDRKSRWVGDDALAALESSVVEEFDSKSM